MAAAAPPPPPLPPQDTFNEAEFLRRTFDRSLAEMERSREFFERLLRHATWYIGIVTTVGFSLIAFLGFRSYSDVESRLNNEMQKVAADITDQGKKTIAQTDEEIRKNAAAAFEQANLKAYIREVAKGKTEQVLAGQINRSVNEQVAHRIEAEQPQIRKAVLEETKKAVGDLSPTISTNISSEVQKQSSEALNPLRQEVNNYREVLRVSTLALEARNGDGTAFDEVERLAQTSPDIGIRQICVSTVNEVYLEMNGPIYSTRQFAEPKTPAEIRQLLADPNPFVRWAAIDALANQGAKDIVPDLIRFINGDPSLWVRNAAYQGLKTLTGQKFEHLRKDQWNDWWAKNKDNWPPK